MSKQKPIEFSNISYSDSFLPLKEFKKVVNKKAKKNGTEVNPKTPECDCYKRTGGLEAKSLKGTTKTFKPHCLCVLVN